MRYIGGKSLLCTEINKIIEDNTTDVKTVIDIFSGSGSVSSFLKKQNFKVFSNDFLYFSFVINRCIININKEPTFEKLQIKNPIKFLNQLDLHNTNIELKDCFIYNNYSPNKTCNRMYFTNNNAIKIDIIRITIERWFQDKLITEDEYFYLLTSLLLAVPFVSNITGTYGAYLKFWDKRALNTLSLEKPQIIQSKKKSQSFNLDFIDCLNNVSADLLYADPPYNSRQYLPNYHILETIAKYDYPIIYGTTGIREYENQKSDFCQKSKVKQAFNNLIKNAKVKYVLISYNTDGLLSTEDLITICKKYSKKNSFKLIEKDYRRYKSKIINKDDNLKEQFYFFEKKDTIYDKSPMNYTGGKYKLLPQLYDFFPNNINTFVDLFCGGCDVCSNIEAKKIYANDINNYLIDFYKKLQITPLEEVLTHIDNNIKKFNLSITNKEGYINFRNFYNDSEAKNPFDLFTLICFAFNNQCRFNNNHDFNSPFGNNRSSFNDTIKNNLIKFHNNIQNIDFSATRFDCFDFNKCKKGDFVYADPPYLITTGSYNDGKRGFNGWTKDDDIKLFNILDELNNKGVKFALSNVIKHKGNENQSLINWMNKYNVHYLDFNYKNSNYHSKNTDRETVEVLITNY